MDVFTKCSEINDLLEARKEGAARDLLISVLDYHERHGLEYSECLNHLIRETGLYPYLKVATASWQERFVFEVFKVDSGETEELTLHREQSAVLKKLLAGESLAVSAPTSFGKTFVIDAFIAIAQPANVMIIVPTIALMDEVRRRIYRKFGASYKIITTTDASLGERNLFVFPQERATGYAETLSSIDLLVVDEFYKASSNFDQDRCPSLLKAILKLSKISKQRYFLAPNIRSLGENVFTSGMEFVDKLDFSTVFLKKHELYKRIKSEGEKGNVLVELIKKNATKTLIYAASYSQIDKVGLLLSENLAVLERPLLKAFAKWLSDSYGTDWKLIELVKHGVGIHNGQIHRSLSQIQIKLFESTQGLDTIVSTSSLIEGVNTSAEAVVLWKNGSGRGRSKLNAFTYKNIIGRAGRMFKYFVGQIYLLEKPPEEADTQLDIDFPDSMLGGIDETEHKESLTKEQVAQIISFRERMTELVGVEGFHRIYDGTGLLRSNDSQLILTIAEHIHENRKTWNGLNYLNSSNPADWGRLLGLVIGFQTPIVHSFPQSVSWSRKRDMFVKFVQVLSKNWDWRLPRILQALSPDVDVNLFFKLERDVTFALASLVHDVNVLQKEILKSGVDVSGFVSRLSHAFLPSVVYQLEEFGLPRMIARKIQNAGLIDFETRYEDLHAALAVINRIGKDAVLQLPVLSDFDRYIVRHFFEGIEPA
ncbi:DEAD/DEAH box helicase [Haloferula sargassicola]|uniref:DEAD/DEAH box helicase n=1 Tax=Haloferula sargassicola TaxID=490096 RepID=A0ABP9UU08_9BACT